MSEIFIHHTHTKRIQDSAKEGWEFQCPYCSYRTRYITQNGNEPRRLEIIDEGDPDARHTSTFPEYTYDGSWIQEDSFYKETTTGYEDDGISLPAHLQKQIEEILKRADTDSWMT